MSDQFGPHSFLIIGLMLFGVLVVVMAIWQTVRQKNVIGRQKQVYESRYEESMAVSQQFLNNQEEMIRLLRKLVRRAGGVPEGEHGIRQSAKP